MTDKNRVDRSKSTTLGGRTLGSADAGRGKDARQSGPPQSGTKSSIAQPTRKPVTPIKDGRIDGKKLQDIARGQARPNDANRAGKVAGSGNPKDRDGRNPVDLDRPRTPINDGRNPNNVAGGNRPGDHKHGGPQGNDQDHGAVRIQNNNTNNVFVNNQSGRGPHHYSAYNGGKYGNYGGKGGYGHGGYGYGGYGGRGYGYRSPYYGNDYFSLSLGYGGVGIGYSSGNFGFSYFSPYYGAYRRPFCNNYRPFGSYYGSGFGSYYGSGFGSFYGSSYYSPYYVPAPVLAAPVCYANALPYVSTVYNYQSGAIVDDGYDYGPTVASVDSAFSDVPLVDASAAKPALESDPTEASPADELTDAQRFMVEGEDAFQRGDYKSALKSAEHAMLEDAENGRVLLFISQSLFAQGEFEPAISAAYQGLSLLEPADWGFVVENRDSYYTDKSAYQAQLEKLNTFISENPDAAYAVALRGYHRGFAGDKTGAAADLKKAVELEARDEFAKQLLDLFTAEPKPAAGKDEELIPPPPVEDK